jgi:uncharacterized protein (DUF427 family)
VDQEVGAVSLTTARGPLGPDPSGRFTTPVPQGLVYVEPFHRRVRGMSGGQVAVDSERVLLVHEPGYPPRYAFPSADAPAALAIRCAAADGYVFVPWDAIDEWFEEEERVFVHPRNPYHRVDCVPTARRLRVELGRELLVDTTDTVGVYESSLAPRLYVARAHVRPDTLEPSDTQYRCVYKGLASFWHARVGDALVEDVAWTYEETTPECAAILGLVCFDTTRADVGEELAPGGEP